MPTDIIFALATPPTRAALHLHRISGPNCIAAVTPLLRNARGGALAGKNALARGAHHVLCVDAQGHAIDDVVLTVFPGPRSFTGEDTLEISSHGNPLITARLQSALRTLGLREAKPGEFTQRAFLNGRLDLAQAEAVNQIIHAETEGGIALARGVSEGLLSAETRALRESLVSVLAHLEAHIDFAEDEVGSFDARPHMEALSDLEERLAAMAATYEKGRVVREGLRIALCGVPNAGKSTLFNALLRSDRAIVTDIPGTTRDVLEERLKLGNCDFVLSDTAGLRETEDTVERLGVERSHRALGQADVVCLVVDGALAQDDILAQVASTHALAAEGVPLLLVLNKCDAWNDDGKRLRIAQAAKAGDFSHARDQGHTIEVACASAATQSISDVEQSFVALHERLTGRVAECRQAVLISARQRDKVTEARARVLEANGLLAAGDYPEKIASTLLAANRALVEVVGEISVDDVLASIFSTFCIGK